MSVHGLAEFPIEGYEHFRQSFLSNAGAVTACESARVYTADDDRVAVLTRWPDHETFVRFSDEMARDMASGGDMAPPVLSELAGDLDPGALPDLADFTETDELVALRRDLDA